MQAQRQTSREPQERVPLVFRWARAVLRLGKRVLFGDDIFISYARRDCATYAAELAAELVKCGFACRLDQWGAHPGKSTPPDLLGAVRRSGMLVVVGSAASLESQPMEDEIRAFPSTKRFIIPIDLCGCIRSAHWWPLLEGLHPEPEHGPAPSRSVLDRIIATASFWRRSRRLLALTIIALVVFLGLSIAASIARRAERAAARNAETARLSEVTAKSGAARAQLAEQQALTRQSQAESAHNHELAQYLYLRSLEPNAPSVALLTASVAAEASDLNTSELARQVPRQREVLATIAGGGVFSPDGKSFLMTENFEARVTDVSSARIRFRLPHKFTIDSTAFSPDSKHFFTLATDRTARVWNSTSGRLSFSAQCSDYIQDHSWAAEASWSPDSAYLLLSCENSVELLTTILVLDSSSGKSHNSFPNLTDSHVTFSPDGNLLLMRGTERRLELTDRDGSHKTSVPGDEFVDFSADSRLILTLSRDKQTALVANTGTGAAVATLPHPATIFSAQFSPDGKLAVTTSFDDTFRVWEVSSSKLTTSRRVQLPLSNSEASHYSATFSPDGAAILVGGTPPVLWASPSFSQAEALTAEVTEPAWRFSQPVVPAFTRDGRFVLAQFTRNAVGIWSAATRRLVALLVHPGEVRAAKFSTDGNLVFTLDDSGEKGTARVWDLHPRGARHGRSIQP